MSTTSEGTAASAHFQQQPVMQQSSADGPPTRHGDPLSRVGSLTLQPFNTSSGLQQSQQEIQTARSGVGAAVLDPSASASERTLRRAAKRAMRKAEFAASAGRRGSLDEPGAMPAPVGNGGRSDNLEATTDPAGRLLDNVFNAVHNGACIERSAIPRIHYILGCM